MYPGNGISETYNISTAYRNRPVKRCKQRRYTRSKDTEGYIYIYIYMYTHIYIYMYTHVYRCLSVCVCVKIKQYVMFMFCCACDSPHTAFFHSGGLTSAIRNSFLISERFHLPGKETRNITVTCCRKYTSDRRSPTLSCGRRERHSTRQPASRKQNSTGVCVCVCVCVGDVLFF